MIRLDTVVKISNSYNAYHVLKVSRQTVLPNTFSPEGEIYEFQETIK
jgi:hypothetical protein